MHGELLPESIWNGEVLTDADKNCGRNGPHTAIDSGHQRRLNGDGGSLELNREGQGRVRRLDFFNAKTNTYRSNQKKGDAMSVGLTPAHAYEADEGFVIVADWHCHPGTDVAASRLSKEDISNAKSKNYFMLVMTSKKDPKKGWPEELLKEIEVVETKDAYRIWNII